ncbi:MAG: hypothetical protein H8E17_20760, partial [Deltaproteobacteria bacterium]|nr:hypothetical protein [Deltaproteobacteria bacterium]
MKPWLKKTIIGFCGLFMVAVIGAGWYLSNTLPIGTGHVAKTLCSNVFISKRNPETVFQEDIAPVHFLFAITKFDVNEPEKSVTSTSFGLFATKAIFREGCGCTVVKGITEAELRRQTFMNVATQSSDAKQRTDRLWPAGDRLPSEQLPAGVDG